MNLDTLHDLFVGELRDSYDGETQLLAAFPRMSKASTAPELRAALESFSIQTEEQLHRLDLVFDGIGLETVGTPCKGIKGILDEAALVLREEGDPAVIDSALISVVQRIKHYEIASYGSLREHASVLAHDRAVALVCESLEEEMEADRLLSKIARYHVHPAALAQGAAIAHAAAPEIHRSGVSAPPTPSLELHAPR